ncbi:hypothetical protein GIB67_005946 [Kingdonia uniflora]|uniref:O-acyltransferase n=1 Tax=Kingdonia uniflora TaxID=39325 RepID=A0A7J7MBT2_9MAGN|nr:hypothetical protein GIB67_005946 [Kingdonia uniflora]
MAITDSPDDNNNVSHQDSDPKITLRKRHNNTITKTLTTTLSDDDSSLSNSVSNGESSVIESAIDSCGGEIGNDDVVVVDQSENDKSELSNGEDCSGGNGGRIKNGRVRDSEEVKYAAYRASTPAHSRVKESPLSSDAIFKQNLSIPNSVQTQSINCDTAVLSVLIEQHVFGLVCAEKIKLEKKKVRLEKEEIRKVNWDLYVMNMKRLVEVNEHLKALGHMDAFGPSLRKDKLEILTFLLRFEEEDSTDSLDSRNDADYQAWKSHAGLFNLCIVVLVAVNSRLIIENLMKVTHLWIMLQYGLLIGSGFWFSSTSLRDWPLFMCCLTLPIFPLGAFMVEMFAQNKFISEMVVVCLHVLITTSTILYPVLMILRFDSAVLAGFTLMLFASTVWLKLVSYAHTSYDMRVLTKLSEKGDLSSDSQNIDCPYSASFKSLVYFMVAPTLCYQPSYPRTTSIRKGWVTRQFLKFVIFSGVMGFIVEQYINPIVKNSQHPLKGNLLNAVERVLKLSVPTLYVWLCMFYCFFHLWLNILAELLRFGDREFYKDWWNAKTIEEYWRMWNMPVHKWIIRHIYFPCLRNGIPKGVSILIAFFVSAIFHEALLANDDNIDTLCVAVPCHIFKFWAFIGIMFQIPLVILTNYLQDKFRNNMVGNMIFWFFFSILGQPMLVLLYYHDLMNRKARI